MNKFYVLCIGLFLLSTLNAQDLPAYQFYNHKGKKVKFQKMVNKLADYDVVLFGEHHNNSINHWLQLKLTEALYEAKDSALILGAEMFERDNQEGLQLYLNEKIDDKQLADTVRLWNNFKTDYKPLVDFAQQHKLEFVATNVPRRYASVIAKKGQYSLQRQVTAQEKAYMAELPIEVDIETPGYQAMLDMMKGHSGMGDPMNFVAAQAIKDATMAASILENLEEGTLFLHYNGDYHSKEYGGIYWYLKKANPNLTIAVISVFEATENKLPLPEEEETILTEFNLVFPADMIKTY